MCSRELLLTAVGRSIGRTENSDLTLSQAFASPAFSALNREQFHVMSADLPSSQPRSASSGANEARHLPGELIDVLEIYYARQLRRSLAQHVKRLNDESEGIIAVDPLRKREARSYYDAMLFTADELLRMLGDEPPGI